jgi:hypothetical protein
MVMSGEEPHRFLIHDHDSIYSERVDRTIAAMGLTILKTPVRATQANAFCERVIGPIRREGLDWMIPCNEDHLRRVLGQWVMHYNRGRHHTSLGPGVPDAPNLVPVPSGHRIRDGHRIVATPILGGVPRQYPVRHKPAKTIDVAVAARHSTGHAGRLQDSCYGAGTSGNAYRPRARDACPASPARRPCAFTSALSRH